MRAHRALADKKVLAPFPCSAAPMERGQIVFGVLFLVLPLLLAAGVLFVPGAAFGLTLALVALLALGFAMGIAFVDWA